MPRPVIEGALIKTSQAEPEPAIKCKVCDQEIAGPAMGLFLIRKGMAQTQTPTEWVHIDCITRSVRGDLDKLQETVKGGVTNLEVLERRVAELESRLTPESTR